MAEQKSKILCVDDERMFLTIMEDYLSSLGYQVFKAEDGDEGLNMFRQVQPDLILLDLYMPRFSGMQMLAHVREESPETAVIIVSGAGKMQQAVESLRLGAWDYIMKPIMDLNVVHQAVENSLGKRRKMVENRKYKEHLEEMLKEKSAILEDIEIGHRNAIFEQLRPHISAIKLGVNQLSAHYANGETAKFGETLKSTAEAVARLEKHIS